MQALIQSLSAMLESCLEQGFQFPLHAAVIASDGALHYVRYDESEIGLDPTTLATYGERFPLPIVLVVTDPNGAAAKMVLEPTENAEKEKEASWS